MVQSVLGSLTLGYRPLWNGARRLAAIELYVHANNEDATVNALHLLRTVQELWSASSPALLIATRTASLLTSFLEHAPRGSPWIVVNDDFLHDEVMRARVQAAHQRGLKLVWRGNLAHLPAADLAACFDNSLLSLQPQHAMAALQSKGQGSPLLDGQMYENLPNRALVDLCLGPHRALAVAGWPAEDVLYELRHQAMQPDHECVHNVIQAIEREQSIDVFEHAIGQDPLLAYRFLVYANSPAVGLRSGVDSIRRALMVMGYDALKRWLTTQLPHANQVHNLRPIRESMVLRARLTERLLEAGVEHDLRAEVYLSGLFSRLDELVGGGEPLGVILRRLPLSERIYNAIVLHDGPYAASLEMACALESDHTDTIAQLRETHEMDTEEINRALLRVLSEIEVERPRAAR